MSKQYHLFISHSWRHGEQYDRLIALLKHNEQIVFRDYSVPHQRPILDSPTDDLLFQAIRRKMATCSVVLILGGYYATHSKWINKEIELAKTGFAKPKPIVAIKPLKAKRLSRVVRENATVIVNWRAKSIVKAILALNEDANSVEVVIE